MNSEKETDIGKKRQGLLRNRIIIVLLIIFVIICGYFGYAYYYINFVKHCKCVEVTDIWGYVDYGYYSTNDFSNGYNISAHNSFHPIHLTYFTVNKTWVLQDKIESVIHFKITDPISGKCIVGDYTPNISIVDNTLSSDVLIINWNDTAQRGSCYGIKESAYYDKIYKSDEVVFDRYNKPLGINQYDEIGTNITLYVPLDIFTGQRKCQDNVRLYQMDLLSERNCFGLNSRGSQTWMVYEEYFV